ncbi:MAG: hypothetical protein CL566_07530 [Alphaproteobacteria bacterium]|nr:hypothetical protein [Alphaproteobacteria bacterium]|tara:strand:+ start:2665 stop:3399 length:735 start_codon:yes stop_codon:yes gene_type:complete
MSLGLSESRNRRRRRREFYGTLFRWGLVLAVGLGVGLWAKDIGTEVALQEVRVLEQRMSENSTESARLRSEIAGLKTALRLERDRVSEWQERYDADVPTIAEAKILEVVRDRVANGVSTDRLAAVVALARDDVGCEPLGDTKRFVVNNEIQTGANDSVSFAEGAITVTASGTSARNAAGQPEAWFDVAVPVRVIFSHLGGESVQASGVLPLHHSVAVGDTEYRFSLIAGARSFVQVTGEACPFS